MLLLHQGGRQGAGRSGVVESRPWWDFVMVGMCWVTMIMMKMMMEDETLFMLVRHGHSLVTECYQRPPSPNTPLWALLSLTGWGVGLK